MEKPISGFPIVVMDFVTLLATRMVLEQRWWTPPRDFHSVELEPSMAGG